MRMIKVTVDGCLSIVEVRGNYEDLAKEIGASYVQRVRITRDLGNTFKDFVMIIDEEGLLKENPTANVVGTILYGALQTQYPIMGDILIAHEGMTNEGPSLTPPKEEEFVDAYGAVGYTLAMADATGVSAKIHAKFDGQTGDDYPPMVISFT